MKALFLFSVFAAQLVAHVSTDGLEGDWQLCVTGPGSPSGSCAPIRIDSFTRAQTPNPFGNRASMFHYSIDLNAVLGRVNGSLGQFGTLITDDSLSRVAIQLGSRDGTRYIGDGGWFLAVLKQTPDSLYGVWEQSCRGGCPARGRVVLRRIKPRQ